MASRNSLLLGPLFHNIIFCFICPDGLDLGVVAKRLDRKLCGHTELTQNEEAMLLETFNNRENAELRRHTTSAVLLRDSRIDS